VALDGDAFVGLFAESTARVLVTVAPGDEERLADLAARHGVPLTRLGETGGDALVVEGSFELPLDELRTAWTATLPAALA
ncbi:MAG: phosphoribosylformylglycinamidine synthase subunit PurL, partial [Nocardioides sp.]